MSFSCKVKTLRSGNSYDLRMQPKMSAHSYESTKVVESGVNEVSEESNIGLSPELVEKKIKASLEPLHAQISALTEMMDRLIQGNLTTESTTASTRGLRLQHASSYSEEPGSSKFPTVAPLTTAEYSPDIKRAFAKNCSCEMLDWGSCCTIFDEGAVFCLFRASNYSDHCSFLLSYLQRSGCPHLDGFLLNLISFHWITSFWFEQNA